MKIKNDWLQGAEIVRTKNFTNTVIKPKFIVLHYTASSTARSAINTLVNPKSRVSAHLVIDTDGNTTQMVEFDKKAWHAGPSKMHGYKGLNKHSIGIEFVNIGYLTKAVGGLMDPYGQFVEYDKYKCIRAKQPRIGSGNYYWPLYPKDQIDVGLAIVASLLQEYPSIEYIVTHEEIDSRGWKTDVGPAFPINRFKKLLDGNDQDDTLDFSVTIDTASLNIRSGPGTKNSKIGELLRGDEVKVLDSVGKWYYIEYEDIPDDINVSYEEHLLLEIEAKENPSNGWIHSGYVSRE